MGKAVHLAVAGDVFDGVFLCCPFSPLNDFDEIWVVIESVSEGFLPTLISFAFSDIVNCGRKLIICLVTSLIEISAGTCPKICTCLYHYGAL